MGKAPRKPKTPDPPARREYGAWSIGYFRPRGCWRVRPPASVDPKRTPHYEKTRADAERWAAQEQARLVSYADHGLSADLTLVDYLGWWIETTAASKRWTATSVETYLSHARRLGDLGRTPLSALRRDQLQSRVAELLTVGVRVYATPPHRRPLTAKSVVATVGTWQRALQDAVDEYELISRNPASRLKLPEVVHQEAETWTPDEVARLRAAIRGHRHEAIYALLIGCGMRIGEALAARWSDVDWERKRLRLRASGTRARVTEHTKGKRRRWAPLSVPLLAILRKRRAEQRWEAEFISENRPGHRITYRTIRDDLATLTAELGIADLGTHAARHHAGTSMHAAGVPLAVIAEVLGHADPAVTARTYLHADEAGRKLALEVLAQLLDDAGDVSEADSG